MIVWCLNCGHQWTARRGMPVRCPSCWGYSIVSEDEIKRASIFIKLPAHATLRESLPPLPSPHELAIAPMGAFSFLTIMSKARSSDAKRRAIKLILSEAGFSEDEIEKYIEMSGI